MDIRLVLFVFALVYFSVISVAFSAPVDPKKEAVGGVGGDGEHAADDQKIRSEIDDLGLEYGRYLQQVVEALEEDKEFAKKLENVSQDEIKNGAIARELDFVSHSVRNKLDELKRIEIERLRSLARKEKALEEAGAGGGGERRWRTLGADSTLIDAEHVDHGNPHSFEAQDLQKLIVSATKDLEALDAKRRQDFKEYEMEKDLRYQEALHNMTAEERAATERKKAEMEAKHKEHPRVHHPGSKKQLEQVWEQQDHMPREEFNPKIFFTMHDVNGDGFLDPQEVEAILSVEIRKMYSEKNAEDDPNEMQEEYHRMREHIYKEADVNRDGLISKKEFLEFTSRMEFERDDGWKGLDETRVYSDDELRQYERQRQQQQQQGRHHQQQMADQYGAYQQYEPQYYPQGYHYPQQGFQQMAPEHFAQQQQYGQQYGHPMAGQHPMGGQPMGGQHQQPMGGQQAIGHQPMGGHQQPIGQPMAGQHQQPMGGQQMGGHQQPIGQPMGGQHPMAGQQQPMGGQQHLQQPNPQLHAQQQQQIQHQFQQQQQQALHAAAQQQQYGGQPQQVVHQQPQAPVVQNQQFQPMSQQPPQQGGPPSPQSHSNH